MEQPVLKDGLKFAITMLGALSVMTCGLLKMPMWPVDNLDLEILVQKIAVVFKNRVLRGDYVHRNIEYCCFCSQ